MLQLSNAIKGKEMDLLSLHAIPIITNPLAAFGLASCARPGISNRRRLGVALFAGTSVWMTYWIHTSFPVLHYEPFGGPLTKHSVGLREVDATSSNPAFTVYYPCERSTHGRLPWLPSNGDVRFAYGAAAYKQMPRWLFAHLSRFTIDAQRNAPLQVTTNPQVFVISHGLAGNMGVHYCLASDLVATHGATVLVVNHADGSASFAKNAHAEIPVVPSPTDIHADLAVRMNQVQYRANEILQLAQLIGKGGLEDIIGRDRNAGCKLHLVGHSFGAASALLAALWCAQDRLGSSLKRSPFRTVSADSLQSVPISSLSLFDLWHWPLERMDLLGPLEAAATAGSFPPRVLSVDSEQWRRWPEYLSFRRAVNLAISSYVSHSIVDSNRTDHLTVTDLGPAVQFGRRPYKSNLNDREKIYQWSCLIYPPE